MFEFINPFGVCVGGEHGRVHRGVIGEEHAERQQDERRQPCAEPYRHDAALGDFLSDDRQGEVDDEKNDRQYQRDGDTAFADNRP